MRLRFSDRGGPGILPPLLILILASACPLYAGGEGDAGEAFDPKAELERAETLIDEGRLDAAIAVLVDLAQHDPEQMERVQDLILEIREIKSLVNDVFEELNQAIVQGDERLAEAKIREIKELDKDPNRNTLNNLILAAIVVSKAINDAVRDDFYARGNALLAAGDYEGAVETYRDGFVSEEYLEFYDDYIDLAKDEAQITRYLDDPGRQEMIWNAYGTIAPEGNRVIGNIDENLDEWSALAGIVANAAEPALQAAAANPSTTWEPAAEDLLAAIGRVEENMAAGSELILELDGIKIDLYAALDGVPEDFRYERILEYYYGRGEYRGSEGIRLAQRLQWETLFLRFLGLLEDRVAVYLAQGRRAAASSDWNGAVASYGAAEGAIRAASAIIASARESVRPQDGGMDTGMAQELDVREAYLAYASEAVPIWIELAGVYEALPVIEDLDFPSIGIENIDDYADPMQEGVARAEDMSAEWSTAAAALSAMPGASYRAATGIDAAVREDLEAALDEFKERRMLLYVNAVTPLYENMESSTRELMDTDIAETRLRIEGAPVSEGSEEIPERHPSDALERIVLPALSGLESAERTIGDFLNIMDQMLDRDPPIDDPERIREFVFRAEALIVDVAEHRDALRELERSASELAASARRAEISASNALDAARRDLGIARAAVERGLAGDDIDEFYRAIDLYDAVEDSLDGVDESYLEMLVYDADIAAASGVDEARTELRNAVSSDRSRLAVSVKGNAVEEARTAYDEGRYSSGLAVLNQSQVFWNRSYGEDDPEIGAWIVRLQNAQQALQQTVIEETDPLFAEMNQYLNLANRYYVAGLRIVESSPGSADALQSFRSAQDLVRQVLNTFPGNEAALLLEQKILRQTDEDTWTAQARSLVSQTRRAVSRGDVEELRGGTGKKGLYAQVKVLEKIDPGFPGLEQLVYDAEVVLGIIIPPPDPAVLAESRRMTEEARIIWLNLGTAGSERAVELLDSALVLWLENEEASRLKNEILLSAEPERLPALPAELLKLLTLVEEAYSQGNFILAEALLDRIDGEFSQFSGDPRVVSWKNKVEARL